MLQTMYFVCYAYSVISFICIWTVFLSMDIFFRIVLCYEFLVTISISDMRMPRSLNSLSCSANCPSMWIFIYSSLTANAFVHCMWHLCLSFDVQHVNSSSSASSSASALSSAASSYSCIKWALSSIIVTILCVGKSNNDVFVGSRNVWLLIKSKMSWQGLCCIWWMIVHQLIFSQENWSVALTTNPHLQQ